MDKEESSVSFEEAMEKLEEIVARLESGDVPLEQAIDLYQEGMKLSRLCGRSLSRWRKKIEMLLDNEEGPTRKPFLPAAEE